MATVGPITQEKHPLCVELLNSISVVIPAFNEEHRIRATLDKVISYLESNKCDYEVIVVNDGSTDGTWKIIEDVARKCGQLKTIHYVRNHGKGFAVLAGVLEAHKELILFTDADLSVPIYEIEKVKARVRDGFDIVIGSRRLPGARVLNQPLGRAVMRTLLNWILRWMLIRDLTDSQCGFKCFRRHVAHDIFRDLRTSGFGFDIELLYLAKKRGYTIAEIPVTWQYHRGSKVRPVLDSITILRDLLCVRCRR